ncbi:hypothetical protein BDV27DRAFT_148092 [Aspergillus caelatus]|uniref:non-specific serine/threonine protein kinase n=1 Tax=Aspergillus caelatus TaxID=61420 RepID=A0A5N6ZU84_9EURO|nr:uncharacterized protein BDV27DRAFT_148092 [Aspergillus caelatus]KAE8361117.1 hypothetical protein BDV27DRAFT_148092 [Aspergillus caelatus]
MCRSNVDIIHTQSKRRTYMNQATSQQNIEEISPVYDSKHFYPANPGEVLADRCQTLVKVGWLHMKEPENVVALKIANKNAAPASHEREVEEHISTADQSHRRRSLIRILLDSFEVEGPEGSYSCLIYLPLREPLSIYQKCFDKRKILLSLIKIYIRALLTELNYLHREYRTLENIIVLFKDLSVLADFLDSQLKKPMAFKIETTGLRSISQLVDFGLAAILEKDSDWGVCPIQPDHYWAPEDMIDGKELFRHIYNKQDCYDAKLYIAEIIVLFGPPAPEIIQRYQYIQGYSWPEPVRQEDSRLCETTEKYFCGLFFDNSSNNILGRFLCEDMIPDRILGDTVSFLEGEERKAFLDLAKGMLVWHPDARKVAGDLAGYSFLQPKQTSA